MVDDTIDIYIESSFFSIGSGIGEIYTSFTAGQLENIGQRDTIVDYQAVASISSAVDHPVEVFTSYSGAFQDGYISTAIKYQGNTSISGMEVTLVDYSTPVTSSGLTEVIDIDLGYFTGVSGISDATDAMLKFTGGQLYEFADNILGNYWIFASTSGENDYEADYTAGGEYDPLIPGPPIDQVVTSGTDDFAHYFTTAAATNSGTIQEEMEVFFPGFPIEFHPDQYTYRFHLAVGDEGAKQGAEWEATVISGAVLDIPLDVMSTVVASGHYNFDLVSGFVDLVSYSFDSETISGTISYFNNESICGVSDTNGYGFDVGLFSLKISNFSLDIDEYTLASGSICVDITDDVYNVVTSGSYFIIEDTVTSGTFAPIVDGYRMCFDSPADFADILGATTFTVHAENDNYDILEQDFYLTSGYIVEYDNRTQDYGFGSQVVVRGSAENLASCPTTGVDAYFFTSTPKPSRDLNASIVGIPYSEEDLSAEIVPTTDTIYFYGKTFRIEVRAKDFAGNVMEPFTFEFRIEDAPE